MPQTTVAFARANIDRSTGLENSWTNPANAQSPDGTTTSDNNVDATGTAGALGTTNLGITGWTTYNLLASEAGSVFSGVKLPANAGVVGIRFYWEVVVSGGTPTMFWREVTSAGNATERSIGVTARILRSVGYGTLSTGSTVAAGDTWFSNNLATDAGAESARALIANGSLELQARGANSNAVSSSNFSLDFVRVEVQWTVVLSGSGQVSGIGSVSGTRKADTHRAKGSTSLLSGIGRVSGVRQLQTSRAGMVWAPGSISTPRKIERRVTGALLSPVGIISGRRQADLRRLGTVVGIGRLSGSRQSFVTKTGNVQGIGVLSAPRQLLAARTGLVSGNGVVSGVRRTESQRHGLITGGGVFSGLRGADLRRPGAIAGVGSLLGARNATTSRTAAIIGIGRLSGSRTAISTRSGYFSALGELSGVRRVDLARANAIAGQGLLSGSYLIETLRTGALSGGPNKLKGWGRVFAFGLSGHVYNDDGTQPLAGATVDLFRTDTRDQLQQAISDAAGYFAFTLTSDPFTYFLVGHLDNGEGPNNHLIDTTDQELEAEVTQVQGPSEPSPG